MYYILLSEKANCWFVPVIFFFFFWGPLPGANTQKWTVRGDTRADRARDFTGKGHLGGGQEGKETQNCPASWLSGSGFMEMALVSGLSLANRLAWPIVWLRVLPGGASLSQDWFRQEGLWEVGCLLPLLAPLDFSWLVFGCNTKFFVETAQASGPGQGRWFQSTVP